MSESTSCPQDAPIAGLNFTTGSLDVTDAPLDVWEAGCQFLGSGGGGSTRIFSTYLRLLAAETEADPAGHPVTVQFRPWRAGDTAAALGIVGSLDAMAEALPSGQEIPTALAALQRFGERSFNAVLPLQIGGVCALVAATAAKQLGLTLLDADLVGRAVPSFQQIVSLPEDAPLLAGLASPAGDQLAIAVRNLAQLEDTVRQLLTRGCGWLVLALCPQQANLHPDTMLPGSLSHALTLGQQIHADAQRKPHAQRQPTSQHQPTSQPQPRSPAQASIDIIASGRVESSYSYPVVPTISRSIGLSQREVRSHTLVDEHTGKIVRLEAISEFLLLSVDGEVAVMAPDIISVHDASTGRFLTPQCLRPGIRVWITQRTYPYRQRLSAAALGRLSLTAFGLDLPCQPQGDLR